MKRLRKILAPSWLKIIMSLLLLVFLPVFPTKLIVICSGPIIEYLSVLKLLFSGLTYRPFELWPQVIVFTPIFAFAVIYLFVAVLAEKIHWAEIIRSFRKFAKPGKAKVIIFAIGMSTLPGFIMMYIINRYTGLMGLPDYLRRIYSLYDNFYFEFIAIPVTFISFLFFNISNFFIAAVYLISFGDGSRYIGNLKFFSDLFRHTDYNAYLANTYGIVIALVLYAMMIVEWYLFACAAVWVFRKIKFRKHQ